MKKKKKSKEQRKKNVKTLVSQQRRDKLLAADFIPYTWIIITPKVRSTELTVLDKDCINKNKIHNKIHDKISDQSKLKAFADDNLNVNNKLKFALGREENIVRKEENAGYQHSLLFPQCFQKASSLGFLKVWIVW